MRVGAAYFLEPSEPAQRRYEAMRAYFVDGLAAGEVAERFGYSPASVHQMASELRVGSAQYFRSSKPGPRSARKADRVRDRVLELRALDRSVEEIAAELVTAGTPVSAQTVWTILHAEGIERLPRRAGSDRGAPPRLAAVKARALADWPADRQVRCDHAGLFRSFPRSHSSGSHSSPSPVATRQRRCSQRGTRSGRCCYTSARGPRAQATRTRSLMTRAWRC